MTLTNPRARLLLVQITGLLRSLPFPSRFRLLQVARYNLDHPALPMTITIPNREGAVASAQRGGPFALDKIQNRV